MGRVREEACVCECGPLGLSWGHSPCSCTAPGAALPTPRVLPHFLGEEGGPSSFLSHSQLLYSRMGWGRHRHGWESRGEYGENHSRAFLSSLGDERTQ